MPKTSSHQFNLYWGDMHTQFKPQWCRQMDWDTFLHNSFKAARSYLDFFPIVYYPALYYDTPQGLRVESIGWRDEYQPEWEKINALVKKYHKPGEFVTFAGYEWTGDRTRWGDHNVFYPDDDPALDAEVISRRNPGDARSADDYVGGFVIGHSLLVLRRTGY